MKFKKKKPYVIEEDEEPEDEPDEFNFCGIRHKRLDDLVAKIGFVVHVVIFLADFYKGKWTWWLNFGSILCYVCLIYGISRQRWYLYLPFFCVNPILVIIQVINMLRISYRGHNLDEGVWTAFSNFVTLTLFVLFITALHVISFLIVLMRFQPFVDYTEKRKRERCETVLDEYQEEQMGPLKKLQNVIGEFSHNRQKSPDPPHSELTELPNLDRPPMHIIAKTQGRVKFSPQNSTYYYTPEEQAPKPILNLPTTPIQQSSNPPRGRQTKSFIV